MSESNRDGTDAMGVAAFVITTDILYGLVGMGVVDPAGASSWLDKSLLRMEVLGVSPGAHALAHSYIEQIVRDLMIGANFQKPSE